jgi:Transglutaminase-like superfamily
MTSPLGRWGKLGLAARIWYRYVLVRALLPRRPLPELIHRFGRQPPRDRQRLSPLLLSRAVHRALHLGSRRPTCLVASLVLFRLLREQGDRAELVIGLPSVAKSKDAHAWVEVDSIDVGPPPGRGSHRPMARFGGGPGSERGA